jgi:hypothetical protein
MAADFRQQVELAHVAEKWRPVFRQGMHETKAADAS